MKYCVMSILFIVVGIVFAIAGMRFFVSSKEVDENSYASFADVQRKKQFLHKITGFFSFILAGLTIVDGILIFLLPVLAPVLALVYVIIITFLLFFMILFLGRAKT